MKENPSVLNVLSGKDIDIRVLHIDGPVVVLTDLCLSPYSKLLLASSEQVLGLVAEEKSALQAQLSQEEGAQACFIQSALCHLQVRMPTPRDLPWAAITTGPDIDAFLPRSERRLC